VCDVTSYVNLTKSSLTSLKVLKYAAIIMPRTNCAEETPLFKIPMKLARQLTISAPPKALYASGAPPYMAIFYGGN
jgi:hypothetical protein